jgi:two-component system chemotaxis sensor kinase CheA
VNELYGATQTVIKPLPAMFKDVSGVSGSAILGNGRVALILDVPALFRDFRFQEARSI